MSSTQGAAVPFLILFSWHYFWCNPFSLKGNLNSFLKTEPLISFWAYWCPLSLVCWDSQTFIDVYKTPVTWEIMTWFDFWMKKKIAQIIKVKKPMHLGCPEHTCELKNSLIVICSQWYKKIADCDGFWVHQNTLSRSLIVRDLTHYTGGGFPNADKEHLSWLRLFRKKDSCKKSLTNNLNAYLTWCSPLTNAEITRWGKTDLFKKPCRKTKQVEVKGNKAVARRLRCKIWTYSVG